MAEQSSFDRNHIETSAKVETSGLLEQLNLPPAVVSFVRANQRALWGVAAVITAVVVIVPLYGSYRNYRTNKAVSALDAAMQAEKEQRVAQLTEVTKQFASTPSSLWARVELAKLAEDKGDNGTALSELQMVNKSITAKNPMKPLVLYRLGALNELEKKYDAAIALYTELVAFAGFAPEAHYAMGRVYVAMGKKDEAIKEYQQYLSLTEETTGAGQGNPLRTLVEYTITQLQ